MNDRTETAVRIAIDKLYAGRLADFIRSRDALTKELRSAGNRDAASAVTALRKPSRPAWALNRVAHREPKSLAKLDAAVARIVDAHAGNGDARAAMAALREAVREYATLAAAESRSAGFSLDTGAVSNALLAVIGNPTSYEELRSGRVSQIPEAGGLDFLTSLPTRPKLEVSGPRKALRPEVDAAEAAAAREQAAVAAEALETARAAVDAAATALAESDADVAAAEEKARVAEVELKAAHQRRDFARRMKESASAELRNAEAASQAAERRRKRTDSSCPPRTR